MGEVPTYVLDASVAFKWLVQLEDEPDTDRALAVLRDYQAGRINILAPVVLDYEIGHALRTAVRRERITHRQGSQLYQVYHELGVPLVDQHAFLGHIWRTASRFDCGFYDACYVWLAADRDLPLLHGDERLRPRVEDTHFRSIWIADYA